VFSSLGFYPVCPGSNEYIIGTPLFRSAKIHLSNGKTFEIRANNVSEDIIYIQSIRVNGQPYTKSRLTHDMIMNGGLLEFEMGPDI
jgi:putative alpha-1,2-mannosidase